MEKIINNLLNEIIHLVKIKTAIKHLIGQFIVGFKLRNNTLRCMYSRYILRD